MADACNLFLPGNRVKKLTYIAGDRERGQLGTVKRCTHDGLVVVEWDNGSECNTHVSSDSLEVLVSCEEVRINVYEGVLIASLGDYGDGYSRADVYFKKKDYSQNLVMVLECPSLKASGLNLYFDGSERVHFNLSEKLQALTIKHSSDLISLYASCEDTNENLVLTVQCCMEYVFKVQLQDKEINIPAISDKQIQWKRYCSYMVSWAEEYSDPKWMGATPDSFNLWLEKSKCERKGRDDLNQWSEATLQIPSNGLGIEEGYYSNDRLADLLRNNKHRHDAIQFIADMIEDGVDTESGYYLRLNNN